MEMLDFLDCQELKHERSLDAWNSARSADQGFWGIWKSRTWTADVDTNKNYGHILIIELFPRELWLQPACQLPLCISLTTIRSCMLLLPHELQAASIEKKAPHAQVLHLINLLSFSSAVSAARGALSSYFFLDFVQIELIMNARMEQNFTNADPELKRVDYSMYKMVSDRGSHFDLSTGCTS